MTAVRLLLGADAEQLCAAIRADALQGWPAVLHCHFLGLGHFFFRLTLYAICFSHNSPLVPLWLQWNHWNLSGRIPERQAAKIAVRVGRPTGGVAFPAVQWTQPDGIGCGTGRGCGRAGGL